MLLFTTREKLELQSVPAGKSSQIVFQNKLLTRGPDFARKLWEKAKKYCENSYDPNSLCVLVEHPAYVSVWKEDSENAVEKAIETVTAEKSSAQTNRIELDTESIARARKELAQFIGPIASLVCDRTLAEGNHNMDGREFIKALAKQIPDSDEAKIFERRLLSGIN